MRDLTRQLIPSRPQRILITLIYQAVPRQTDARQPVVVTIGVYQCRTRIERHSGHGIAQRHHSNIEQLRLQRMRVKLSNAFALRLPRLSARRFRSCSKGCYRAWSTTPRSHTLCANVAGRLLGPENVLRNEPPSMGAEDFADYLPVVPGCMIGLGAKAADRKVTPLHTATFDIDETALLIGARLFAAMLLEWPKNPIRFGDVTEYLSESIEISQPTDRLRFVRGRLRRASASAILVRR